MTPTPDQIKQAIKNHQQPARTPHARIRDALARAENSQKKARVTALARIH